jgi:hypothetical protein
MTVREFDEVACACIPMTAPHTPELRTIPSLGAALVSRASRAEVTNAQESPRKDRSEPRWRNGRLNRQFPSAR